MNPMEFKDIRKNAKPATYALVTTMLVLFVITAMRSERKAHVSAQEGALDQIVRMSSCRDRVLNTLKLNHVDLQALGSIHGLCYAQINEEDTLADFSIRRSAFLSQQVQTPVMLWMVVAITFSGVVLAAIQLIAAYKLASTGKGVLEQGGQLSLEHNKISLSSSVTGITVLALSLGFFYIFVSQVYLIKELKPAPASSAAGVPDLTAGWITSPGSRPLPMYTGALVQTPEAATMNPNGAGMTLMQAGGLGPAPVKPPETVEAASTKQVAISNNSKTQK